MFTYKFKIEDSQKKINLDWNDIVCMIKKNKTPVRALSDKFIQYYLPFLYGENTIYELGAPSDYYKNFVPESQSYQITNYDINAPLTIDMTAMNFKTESVTALFSAYALEHVLDYKKAIAEMKRVLRPGGRILLVVPFLYYFHGAPDDYIRFTKSYLRELFSDMNILDIRAIGNRSMLFAELLDERPFTPTSSKRFKRCINKFLSYLFMAKYCISPGNNSGFASAHILLAEKIGRPNDY